MHFAWWLGVELTSDQGLSHVRRENHRSKGYLTLRWGSHPVVDDMSFAAVDSSNNTLLLLDNGTPIDNDFDDPDPDELIWSLRAMDRSTLNYRYDDNLPPAKSYKMDVDRNAGVFLYRFRHTAATNQSPAMDWVELWIPHFHIHSFCPLQKEIGTLPDGVLHIAQCHEGICGFYPIAAINLAEVGATRATFHAHSTRYTDGTLRLWMSIGDKTSLLGGKPLPISSQGLMEVSTTCLPCRCAPSDNIIRLFQSPSGMPDSMSSRPPVLKSCSAFRPKAKSSPLLPSTASS